ncbi:MAG TPA: hypothetical protein PKK20_12090, partial [Verrucomicrobiota bacterium]|nr:hypothetical protein [Verrucomicrobiota bacterium]
MNGHIPQTHRRTHALATVLAGALTFLCSADPPATNLAPRKVQVAAGDLEGVFHVAADGIRLDQLRDRSTTTILATNAAPLFALTITNATTREHRIMTASEGWGEVDLRVDRHRLRLRWGAPLSEGLAGIAVSAIAALDQQSSALRWTLHVDNRSTAWAVRQTVFPQLAVPELAHDAAVLFPRGPGEVQRGLWRRPFTYRGNYPDGWCAMQFLAAYREGESPVGVYLGFH